MAIAVIGSNMVDLISYISRMPAQGETVEAPDFALGCGGKGANQAIAASRLGSDVVMVTRVGNDVFADTTVQNFADHGIDTTHVLRTDATSGVAPIFVDPDSNNSIIIVKGANAHLTPADVERARADIARCDLIVLQLEIPLETVYAAIALGEELGIPVLLNPAPASPGLELDRIRAVQFFVPNETELELLTGMPVEDMTDIRKAARVLVRQGITHVIVTLSAKGALWVTGEHEEHIEGVQVAAHDTTGAGDAFIGCFSHTWVQTGDIETSIRTATLYAADSVTRAGTQTSYARAGEFQDRFANQLRELTAGS
ncbi:ribokinase [Helcobacillus sp. ACRRO]|uniref:ribokinase n=1 Tax=Helcobacillus TaxID=1161125 RepID=UPI001EF676A2|nr:MULTISPECIES: ribokinase [Helcobacillus]MCG7427085.1 ribokinase [Helcobacillus sp. ACRRO]MDK7742964.1 ribokinase [Helcobacillus massiliensis]WOO93402.1 ribokinase [Helcobacillus massiliensis]